MKHLRRLAIYWLVAIALGMGVAVWWAIDLAARTVAAWWGG